MKKWDWLGVLLDFKDALCNLETGLLDREAADDLKRYLLRADRRWRVFKARVERVTKDNISGR